MGNETVLVVEDDEQLRTVTSTVLARLGYRVLSAANGVQAVRVAREHKGRIDLLLTDVVMPVMGGRETAEQVTALRPDTKVLFVSGHTESAIVHHGVLDPGIAFLSKPSTPTALAVKLREVLDEQPGR